MRFLDLREIVRIVVLASAAYACGGAERTFIDDYASGGASGSGGEAGSSGGASGAPSTGTGGGGTGGSSGRGGGGGKAGSDAGSVADARDASDARDAADTGEMQPPPPPPGRPGLDNSAGGMWMKSTGFKAFVATGETPGYNGVYTSPNFRLRTGVIGTTQP